MHLKYGEVMKNHLSNLKIYGLERLALKYQQVVEIYSQLLNQENNRLFLTWFLQVTIRVSIFERPAYILHQHAFDV